jgi:hypothetical protein
MLVPAAGAQTDAPLTRAPALPPATQAATTALQPPCWLRVKTDEVNLRAHPDLSSLIVARVGRDATLYAVAAEPGWFKIMPPVGTYSLVNGQYVRPVSDTRGVVAISSGTLRVRAGSQLLATDPLLNEVQALLASGTPVDILGREGDWLRIVPPEGVFFYVSSDYAEPISDEVATRLGAARPPVGPTQPVVGSTPESPPAASTQPVTLAEHTAEDRPELSGPWGQELRKVEQQIEAESRKPALDQNWVERQRELRPIAMQRDEPAVATLAQEWLRYLDGRIRDQEAHPAGRGASPAGDADAAPGAARQPGPPRADRTGRPGAGTGSGASPAFLSQGELLPAFAIDAGPHGLRYMLRNTVTGTVEAYVEFPLDRGFDPVSAIRKYVGVNGESYLDRKLGVRIITVHELTVVSSPPSASANRP